MPTRPSTPAGPSACSCGRRKMNRKLIKKTMSKQVTLPPSPRSLTFNTAIVGLIFAFFFFSSQPQIFPQPGAIALAKAEPTMKLIGLPQAASRIRDEPESVWVEFIQLALEHKPLNLGQGFPDFAAPKYLIDSLHAATNLSDPTQVLNNQYTRSFGHPRLIKALVRYYNDFRYFKELQNPNNQVLVTVGAYEALFASIMAFVEPGDEVLIIDPAFDAYKPMVELAQGRAVFVPLRYTGANATTNSSTTGDRMLNSSQFRLDMAEFESKISNRTRLLVLNTPNNPLGKMYSLDELNSIARLCRRHNILVVADEVYEQMYYPPETHLSIASLPGMWDRTITIGSAGKTFSVTGWKLGWALGPRHLIKYVQLIHQTAIYTVATPLQEAAARALEHEMELLRGREPSYWQELRAELARKRDRMANILAEAGMRPVVPQGGYFMLADFSALARQFPQYKQEGQVAGKANTNDYMFARWLSRAKKLQGIPASAFYSAPNKPLAENLVRFCFIKQDSTLDALMALIESLASSSGSPSSGGGGGNESANRNSSASSPGDRSQPGAGGGGAQRSKL